MGPALTRPPESRASPPASCHDDSAPNRFAIGRLASMTDLAGTTTYDYERRDLLAREQRTVGGCFVTRDA